MPKPGFPHPQIVDMALTAKPLSIKLQQDRLAGRVYHLLPRGDKAWAVWVMKGGLRHPLVPARNRLTSPGNANRWLLGNAADCRELAYRLVQDLGVGSDSSEARALAVASLADELVSPLASRISAVRLNARVIEHASQPLLEELSDAALDELAGPWLDVSEIRQLTPHEMWGRVEGKTIVIVKAAARSKDPGTSHKGDDKYSFAMRSEQGGVFSNVDLTPWKRATYAPMGFTYLQDADVYKAEGDEIPAIYGLISENMVGRGIKQLDLGLARDLGDVVESLAVGQAAVIDAQRYFLFGAANRESLADVISFKTLAVPSLATLGAPATPE